MSHYGVWQHLESCLSTAEVFCHIDLFAVKSALLTEEGQTPAKQAGYFYVSFQFSSLTHVPVVLSIFLSPSPKDLSEGNNIIYVFRSAINCHLLAFVSVV